VESALARQPDDYWALATRAEMALLREEPSTVRGIWSKAVLAADRDWFALDSSRQTVHLLQCLQFRPEATAIALDVLERELARCTPPAQPRQVFLFTGHMMDRPDREKPRFPPAMSSAVEQRLAEVLDRWAAGPEDMAYCQAAAGGDLLFLEACLARGVRCQVLLPFDEPTFIQESIAPSQNVPGVATWRDRWLALKPRLAWPPRMMPVELGQTRRGDHAYERCNQWLLNSALAHGSERLRFITLWNGETGDGPGGTAHLKAEAKRRTLCVEWIDTRTL
jgi:hypothetical protein